MEEQTFNTDPEGQNVSPAEGDENVQKSLNISESVINKLSEITGRKFKDEDDFQRHYKELSSFVGENPKELKEKARLYDEQINSSKTKLKEIQKSGSSNEEITKLKNKIEEMELLKDYPDASKILDTIRAVAKSKETDLKSAFESDLQELLKSKLDVERRQEEERNSSVESKNRISSTKSSKLASLAEEYKRSPSDVLEQEIVKEFLSK